MPGIGGFFYEALFSGLSESVAQDVFVIVKTILGAGTLTTIFILVAGLTALGVYAIYLWLTDRSIVGRIQGAQLLPYIGQPAVIGATQLGTAGITAAQNLGITGIQAAAPSFNVGIPTPLGPAEVGVHRQFTQPLAVRQATVGLPYQGAQEVAPGTLPRPAPAEGAPFPPRRSPVPRASSPRPPRTTLGSQGPPAANQRPGVKVAGTAAGGGTADAARDAGEGG